MTYGIEVENGEKIKCPNCHSNFAIKNEKEILFRNITLLHISGEKVQAKCKQCKYLIQFDMELLNSKITID